MNLVKPFKYLSLLVSASSTQIIHQKNFQGDWVKVPIRRSAFNELKRPPLVLTAPETKKIWSQKETEEFYQNNAMFNHETH